MTPDTPTDDDAQTIENPGASDLVTFEVVDAPDPEFRIEQVGKDPDIRYRYHHADRGDPTPEAFETVNHLEVKLAVLSTDLDGVAAGAADEALSALCALREAMCDQRGLDDETNAELALGSIDALPEVEGGIGGEE